MLHINNQKHPFHLVDPSPWPIVAAFGGFCMVSGGVGYMHNYAFGGSTLSLGVFIILYVMFTWWRDIVREGTLEGQHTDAVQQGLRMGMILFIVSEVMFFFAFFWAFFSF
jgi:cytochrome c oxidase subunit 3